MNWVSNEKTLAVFYEVDDKRFEEISLDGSVLLDHKYLNSLERFKGNNVIIFLLINKGGDINSLLCSNRYKYKKIGFWNREHKRFYKIGE